MTPRRRVAYLIASSAYGGAEQALATLLGALDRERFAAWVVCPPGGPMLREYAWRAEGVWPLDLANLRDPTVVPRLTAWLRALRPDVVHTHLWTADLLGGLAATLARVPTRVATVHGEYFRADGVSGAVRSRRLALARTYRATYRLFDRTIAVSRAVARDLRDRPGVHLDPRRLRVVYNGLDLARLQATAPLSRAALGLPTAAPLVTCVGNLFAIKGQRWLIEALPRVLAHLPDARLLLVGAGPEAPALRQRVAARGLQAHVRFLGARPDAPGIMRASDVVAVPSLAEGLSLVTLEALALGKPVVASRTGGIPEIVTHGASGLLVPPANPVALAEALLATLTQRAYAERLAARGRAQVEQRFSAQAMAEQTMQVYTELAAWRGRPSGCSRQQARAALGAQHALD